MLDKEGIVKGVTCRRKTEYEELFRGRDGAESKHLN